MADALTIKHWDGPPLDAWRAWRPEQAAEQLAGVGIDWCVVGGWSIDLWLGRETRPHDDLEIAILRDDFAAIRTHLNGFELHSVGDGEVRRLAPHDMPPADKHQNWVLDPAANAWRMDIMMESGDAQTWVFRRDPSIRAPRSRMIGTRDGVRFLKPEGALLYKAKAARPKDEADFAACLPALDDAARRGSAEALSRAHPDHPWIAALSAVSGPLVVRRIPAACLGRSRRCGGYRRRL